LFPPSSPPFSPFFPPPLLFPFPLTFTCDRHIVPQVISFLFFPFFSFFSFFPFPLFRMCIFLCMDLLDRGTLCSSFFSFSLLSSPSPSCSVPSLCPLFPVVNNLSSSCVLCSSSFFPPLPPPFSPFFPLPFPFPFVFHFSLLQRRMCHCTCDV